MKFITDSRIFRMAVLSLLLILCLLAQVNGGAQWGEWGDWSTCSRSCGRGVAKRSRQCNTSRDSRRQGLSTCVGPYVTFKLCNTQPCENGEDFRSIQCRKYNVRSFAGKRYKWEPYIDERDMCGLSCRAVGFRYHTRFADSVIDGTPCDASYPEKICISGRCGTIGCDGVVGSEKVTDRCGVCGGDNSTCHIITGLFTRRTLPYGYSRVTVIPRGACSINITEMQPSDNYLALRLHHGRYLINGQSVRGASHTVNAAGTSFIYKHRPQTEDLSADAHEMILSDGPLNASIDVMVWRVSENRGIRYSYTVPAHHHHRNANSTRDKHQKHRQHRPSLSTEDDSTNQPQGDEAELDERQRRYRLEEQRRRQQILSQQQRQQQILQQQQLQEQQRQQLLAQQQQQLRQQQLLQQQQRQRQLQLLRQRQLQRQQQRQQQPQVDRQRQVSAVFTPPEVNPSGTRYTQVSRQDGAARTYSEGGEEEVSEPDSIDTDAAQTHQAQPVPPDQPTQPTASPRIPRPRPGPNFGVQNFGRTGQGISPGNSAQTSRLTHSQQPYYLPPSYSQPRVQSVVQTQPVPQYPARQQYTQSQSRVRPVAYGNQRPYYGPTNIQSQAPVGQQYPGGIRYPSQSLQPQVPYNRFNPGQVNNVIQPYVRPTNRNRFPDSGVKAVAVANYGWRMTGLSECSRQCGGGFHNITIVCVKSDTQAIVTDNNCDNIIKPNTRPVPCENRPCPPSWEVGEWGQCSTSCNTGQRIRTVMCRQRISNTALITVSSENCRNHARPPPVEPCNEDNPCIRWGLGEWSSCSAECGRGVRSREVVCVTVENVTVAENVCEGDKPPNVEICDMGSCVKTWFHSPWSQQCSTTCGEGVLTRRVHCGGDEALCRRMTRPRTEKTCRNEIPCGGSWFTGPWGSCSVSCGEGVIQREVTCLKRSGRLLTVVGEENCHAEDKPISEKPCTEQPCGPTWFATAWSQCDRSCGTGIRTRELKCLDENDQISLECSDDSRPETREPCSGGSCAVRVPPRQENVNTCVDQRSGCSMVAQARLCRYDYYKDLCCETCKGSR